MKLLAFAIALLAISACSKDKLTGKDKTSFEKFMSSSSELSELENFIDQVYQGDLIISSTMRAFNRSYASTHPTYTVAGAIRTNDLNDHVDVGEVRVGDQVVSERNELWDGIIDGSSFSGKTTTVALMNSDNSAALVTHSIYCPLPFEGAMPEVITPGSTITWNEDPDNKRGVVIRYQFADEPHNLPSAEEHWIYVSPDNGTYTFTSADLAGVTSEDKMIQIELIRGDYTSNTMVGDEESKNALYLMTTLTGMGRL